MTASDFKLAPLQGPVPQGRVITDPEAVRLRLLRLSENLTPEVFFDAMRAGLGSRSEAIPLRSAPTEAGLNHWLAAVKLLRGVLADKGWQPLDRRNSPLIISQDQRIAIVVMTGDAETGRDSERQPRNQAEKGGVTQSYVEANSQAKLLYADALTQAEQQGASGTQVWVLLYHYDKRLDEVRFELSRPNDFHKGYITSWAERLILGSLSNAADHLEPEEEAPSDIFEVEPRSARQ